MRRLRTVTVHQVDTCIYIASLDFPKDIMVKHISVKSQATLIYCMSHMSHDLEKVWKNNHQGNTYLQCMHILVPSVGCTVS